MIIALKTAHGYLSFQPDGRIEYRAVRGSWEELEVEGFTVPPSPSPPGTPTPPAPPAQEPTTALVAIVKADLQRTGVSLSGPCGAFAITQRVAWLCRGSGAGLLAKSSGNQCQGYAVDIVAYPDRAYDVLSDAGGANTPQAALTGVDDLAARWRPPVEPPP